MAGRAWDRVSRVRATKAVANQGTPWWKSQTWVAVAFIAAVVLAAFWKLAAMKGVLITDDIFASDLMNENFPYRFSIGNALRSGQWPLWVREIYGGFPLLARSEAGVCYPINIVLFGLFWPDVVLNLAILLIVLTAGIGMYFLAREIEASHLASTLGGIAFGFSGYPSFRTSSISAWRTALAGCRLVSSCLSALFGEIIIERCFGLALSSDCNTWPAMRRRLITPASSTFSILR